MSATFQWSESNGAGETVTDGISNLNFGSNDSPNIVPSTYRIVAGENSFEKYIRGKFSGTFTEISNMKFWKSVGGLVTGEAIKTDEATAYAQPVATTSSVAVTDVPTAEGSAIVVHAANGNTTITAVGYTKYLCLQLQTTGSTPAGSVNQKTFTLQYDEV